MELSTLGSGLINQVFTLFMSDPFTFMSLQPQVCVSFCVLYNSCSRGHTERLSVDKAVPWEAGNEAGRLEWAMKPCTAPTEGTEETHTVKQPSWTGPQDKVTQLYHKVNKHPKQQLGLLSCCRRVHSTRRSRGKGFCRTCSCCSILLLKLQVLLLAWSKDSPDRERLQIWSLRVWIRANETLTSNYSAGRGKNIRGHEQEWC